MKINDIEEIFTTYCKRLICSKIFNYLVNFYRQTFFMCL